MINILFTTLGDKTINRKSSVILTITLLLFITSACFYTPLFVSAQTDQAGIKLQAANNEVTKAFNAVSDAEKAGANVTGLIGQLNDAAGVLAQAENSYQSGDSSTVAAQADNVVSIAQQVTATAQNAKQTALVSSQNAFWQMIGFTVIGAIIFVLALALVWRWLKSNYITNLREAKPEVTIIET